LETSKKARVLWILLMWNYFKTAGLHTPVVADLQKVI
jgi:hypothetical protein